MRPAQAVVALGVALACAAQSPAPPDAPLTGPQVLARVKAVFRSHPRPPFVAYTLVRRDLRDGAPDYQNSYTLKVWCRTADRSALARRAWRGKAYGSLQNITVMFDRAVDPGPPTADMFEKRLFGAISARRDGPAPGQSARPALAPGDAGQPPPDSAPLAEIGRVGALDGDYGVARSAREGDLIHLWLEPKSDRDRNRLDEMWVDATTYDLRRTLVRDHLYFAMGGMIDDEFDVRFTPGPAGLPLIRSIRGETRYGQYVTEYTFNDVTFPDELPEWYFEPKLYGSHMTEAPA